jgi:hypothetical protein
VRKIQIWFRGDQAECVVDCLDFLIKRHVTREGISGSDIDLFALRTSRKRVEEVRALIAAAIAKATA